MRITNFVNSKIEIGWSLLLKYLHFLFNPVNNLTLNSGNFLLATEKLKDSYFEDSVIFMASVSEDQGIYGFIVNRLSHMPSNEVFSGVPKNLWQKTRVFLGGPVSETEIQVLKVQTSTESSDHAEPILFKNLKDSESFFGKLFDHDQSLLFMGYSGWSYDQLQKEVEDQYWHIVSPHDPLLLFNHSPEDLQLPPTDFLTRYC